MDTDKHGFFVSRIIRGRRMQSLPRHGRGERGVDKFFCSGKKPITSLVNFFRTGKNPFWPKTLFSASERPICDARAFFPLWKKPDDAAIELFPFRKKVITPKKVLSGAAKPQKRRWQVFSVSEKSQSRRSKVPAAPEKVDGDQKGHFPKREKTI